MSVTLEIRVTKSDIEEGDQSNGQSCAIARRLDLLGFKNVAVDSDEISLEGETLETPDVASKFIGLFDRNKNSVKPFRFRLRVPHSVIENMKMTKALKSAIIKCDRKLQMAA